MRPLPPEGHRESRRWVLVPEGDILKRGRYSKVFGYNARTIARLAGVTVQTVRKAVTAGALVLHDLGSVLHWLIGQVRPGDTRDSDAMPPLWRYLEDFSLISGAARQPSGPNQIYLAAPMPAVPAYEEVVRLFWSQRSKLRDFAGSSYELARKMLELDGIKAEDLPARPPRPCKSPRYANGKRDPHRQVERVAEMLRKLVKLGVLAHDPETKTWGMAPAPNDLEGITAGLRAEGFEEATVVERHVAIGRDYFSLPMARRLLAYMRTNRIKAHKCGRDRRLWIVTGMDRAMHGYKSRKIFRRGVTTDAGGSEGHEPRA